MVRRGEIEAGATRLHGEYEDARPVRLLLEAADHLVARFLRRAAMEEHDLAAEVRTEVVDELVAHLAELREDQRLVARGHRFFEHLGRARELSRALRKRAALAEVLGGMVADLLGEHQQREHSPPALDAVRGLDAPQLFVDHGLVERRLLARERADDLHLVLRGQVLDDGRVTLEAAQDERTHDAA